MARLLLGFVLMISCTVGANLLMKLGASTPEAGRWFGVVSPLTATGIGCFGLAAIMYAWLLHHLPLNVAQAFAAVQFLAVILAARWVLSEPVTSLRWVGILLIAIGIAVVGWTADSSGSK
jgi:drug/metabolite transporter (DMT)-like permease